MGLQNKEHERFMKESEKATARLTDNDLQGAASTLEEATTWKQLSQEMKHMPISVGTRSMGYLTKLLKPTLVQTTCKLPE